MTTETAPQEFTFQTEIKQLLHILSHSLYQNREIAIRELVSNASDSLNKLRHIQLAEDQFRDDVPLEIVLEPNKDEKVLVIRDTGIGLTHDELIQNLGTIAHSGSKEFLNKLSGDAKGDLSLIGQFGVGFYSAFMLADRVEVITRSYKETTGWKWESDGTGRFTIEPAGDVPRGAQIRLHLKEGYEEFTDAFRLKFIIRKYSTFVPHPVRLDGETLNEQKPIWVEPKSQLTDEQYDGFYQWLTHHAEEKPLWRMHLQSDSPLQFHAILYSPPKNLEQLGFGRVDHGLNLCAKRILVQDNCQDLLPDYLHFLYGVVDSADLPLNVSRETLQDHKLLPKLKKVLTKKVLDFLAELAEERPEDFKTFHQQFGSILRTGLAQDFENRERIAKLMRFHSTFGDDREVLVSLDDYVKRAAEGQTQIYYLSGPELSSLAKHPLLEPFRKRNLEVLLLTDPVDEFAITHVGMYEEKQLISIDSVDVKFPESTNPPDEEAKPSPKGLPRVIELFRGALSEQTEDVKESSRLTDSPVCLINAQGGLSSQLQKILSQNSPDYQPAKRILEVNPQSALIGRLSELSTNSENDEFIRDCGRQLYANALFLDGLVAQPEETTQRILRFMEEAAQKRSGIVV